MRELELFVAVMLLENILAVFLTWEISAKNLGTVTIGPSGQKPHLIKNGEKFHCDTSSHVPFVVPGLSTSSSTSSSFPTSSSKETVTDTEIPATRGSESGSEDFISTVGPVA